MKKTFNNFRTLVALLMAGAALAACSSNDDNIIEQQPANPREQVYTLTINASKSDGTTRALDLDGTGKLTASWTNGDELTVVNQTKDFTPLGGTLVASNASGNTATFAGTLTGTIEVDDKLILTYHDLGYFTDFPDQDGTLKGTNGAEKYDVANATVTVASVDAGNITIDEASASFKTWTAMFKLTLQDGNSNPLNPTSLTISVDGIGELLAFSPTAATYATNGDGILYFALPNDENVAYIKMGANSGNIDEKKAALAAATVTFTATVGSKTYTTTKTGYKFAAGKYYAATLTMAEVAPAGPPSGAIDGLFTINASGDQVYFSQGNLKYSNGTWSFHTNQYDMCFTSTGDVSANYTSSGTFDLFGYGTSGYLHKEPYTTSVSDGDYYASNIAGTEYDWGVHNTISNGGTGWRTLTWPEWNYLLNTRTTTSGLRWHSGSVNGVLGIILLPDNWTNPVPSHIFINVHEEYDSELWATYFEPTGAVFLPVFGYRGGTNVMLEGSVIRSGYWTSSFYSGRYPYCVDIYSGAPHQRYDQPVMAGNFVRLVKDAN